MKTINDEKIEYVKPAIFKEVFLTADVITTSDPEDDDNSGDLDINHGGLASSHSIGNALVNE